MHIMCVRGVYVTDPAHNIIVGGKWPAIFGRIFLTCFFIVFVVPPIWIDGGRVFLLFGRFVRRFSFFLFACCCGPRLGLIFFSCWAMLKNCRFFQCFL